QEPAAAGACAVARRGAAEEGAPDPGGRSSEEELQAERAEGVRAALQEEVSTAFGAGAACVHLVGSHLYGAALPLADVDLLVELSEGAQRRLMSLTDTSLRHEDRTRLLATRALMRLRQQLDAGDAASWGSSYVALDARRPILRLQRAGVPVDVSFDQSLAALCKSALLAECGARDARPLLLARLVRAWAQARGLSGQRRGYLSGYAWCLLAVFFCQLRGLLGALAPPSRLELSAFGPGAECAPRPPAAPLRLGGGAAALRAARALLPGFFAFLARDFDWATEV
ncbi:unnamed protein product, partial [Prorocentrum cordatum]